SSHQLDLVERLCDDVVILDRGRVVAAGAADDLRAGSTRRRVRLRVDPHPQDPATVVEGAPSGMAAFLDQVPGVSLHEQHGTVVVVDLADGADDQELLDAARRHGAVREMTPVRPTLSEIFREVVR
ncbi:hypothetical protein N869_12825, partial [Cellulomonas bogoriensis 69B4 = DSM 16987]